MKYFSLELSIHGRTGLAHEKAREALRKMSELLAVPKSEFVLSGVRKSGTYYIIFTTEGARSAFAGLLKGAGIESKPLEGAPSGVEIPPRDGGPVLPDLNWKSAVVAALAFGSIVKILRNR